MELLFVLLFLVSSYFDYVVLKRIQAAYVSIQGTLVTRP